MRLATAFWAQSAEATPEGKFHVFGGGFDHIELASPSSVPLVALLRIEFPPEERGADHFFQWSVDRPTGESRGPTQPERMLLQKSLRGDDQPGLANIVLHVALPIKQAGKHVVHFFVDEKEIGILPMYVEVDAKFGNAGATGEQAAPIGGPADAEAEWEELDRRAMSAGQFRSLAEYLRSTGKASA